MAERHVDAAIFAAGVRDVPAFGEGGATAMRNYIVDRYGEVVERPGYKVSDEEITYLLGGSVVETLSEPGAFVVADNTEGVRRFFRLTKGATFVIGSDRLYVAEPDKFTGGFWVDLKGSEKITRATVLSRIHTWGALPRPGAFSDSRVIGRLVETTGDGANDGLDRSFFRPIYERTLPRPRIRIEVYVDVDSPFTIKIYDVGGRLVRTVVENAQGLAGNRYTYTWNGENDLLEAVAAGQYFPAVSFGNTPVKIDPDLIGGISHPFFIGLTADAVNPDTPLDIRLKIRESAAVADLKLKISVDENLNFDTTFWEETVSASELSPGEELKFIWRGDQTVDSEGTRRYISQTEFENAYLTVEFGSGVKRRYYLHSHRGNDIAGQIGASLQAGLQVAQIAPTNPYVLGAGAAVAVAGTAGSLINRAREGERIRLRGPRTEITPASDTEKGFYPGPVVYCCTFSDTPERTVETLPSTVATLLIYDFEGLASEVRTLQGIDFELPLTNRVAYQYEWLNIYAARSLDLFENHELPQETGLDFRLVAQIGLGESLENRAWRGLGVSDNVFDWRNEAAVTPEKYLASTDNDPPSRGLSNITDYGARIWGVDREDNSVRYSKLGPYGYHHFPSENTLVPQILTFDNDASPIVRIHPAGSDSMLYIFKNDVIHILRGHGEIRGLHNPRTPIDVDIDASIKIENTGTSSPRSVCTLKNTVMFVGSDKILYNLAGFRVTPFSLAVQPYIERLTDEELANIFAFEYRNCYHLCLPNEVLVLDLQKKYWTIFDWSLTDAFWAQRSTGEGSKLYALDTDDRLLELYSEVSDEPNFACEWEGNPFKLAYQGLVSGMYVYHDESVRGKLEVSLRMNNGPYETRTFTPATYNRFRQGFSMRGHRAQIKIRDANEKKLRIDRIQLGIET